MAKLTQLERTAYHEAGHVVAAYKLRSRIKRATIEPNKGYLGRVFHNLPLGANPEKKDMTPRMADRIERRIVINFAGGFAEYLAAGWHDRVGQESDERNIVDHASKRFKGKTLERYLAYLYERAIDIVVDCWPYVDYIAELLLERTTIEVQEIIKAMDTGNSKRKPRIGLPAKVKNRA